MQRCLPLLQWLMMALQNAPEEDMGVGVRPHPLYVADLRVPPSTPDLARQLANIQASVIQTPASAAAGTTMPPPQYERLLPTLEALHDRVTRQGAKESAQQEDKKTPGVYFGPGIDKLLTMTRSATEAELPDVYKDMAKSTRFNLRNTILARFELIASKHGWGDCTVAVTPDLVALIKSGNFGSAHLDDLGVGLQPFLCVPQTAQQRAQSDANLQLYDMYIDGTSTLHMQELRTAQAQYKIRFPSTFGQTMLTLRTFHSSWRWPSGTFTHSPSNIGRC